MRWRSATSWRMDWAVLKRVRLVTGPALSLLIGAVVLIMFAYPGRDEEHKTFYSRFVVHDHLRRMGGGIHGDSSKRGLGFTTISATSLMVCSHGSLRCLQRSVDSWAASERAAQGSRRDVLSGLVGRQLSSVYVDVDQVPPLRLGRLWRPWLGSSVFGSVVLSRDRFVWAPPIAALTILLGVAVANDLVRFPWEWMDLTTYHYINYKPQDYFPSVAGGQCDSSTTYCWILGSHPRHDRLHWPLLVGITVVTSTNWLWSPRLRRLSIRWRRAKAEPGVGRFGARHRPLRRPSLLPGARSALDPLIARWDLFQAPSTGGPLGRLSDELARRDLPCPQP